MLVFEYCSIKGMDLVMAALPRLGFPYLHLVLDTFDMQDSFTIEEQDAMMAQLANSLPHSVQSLAVFSHTIWLPRVPLVTTSLTIDMEVILDSKTLRMTPNPLAPTLTHLVLKQGRAPTPLLKLLPASLVHLELSYVNLSRDDLPVLERSFLPNLASLVLSGDGLTAADLDEQLTDAWPPALTHLDLSLGFEFEGQLPMIPPTVRVLTMDLARALKSVGGDAKVAAWITNLPPSMRVLKLYLDSACRSIMIDVMLTVAQVRMPGWPRMHEWNDAVDLPAAVWTALAARFGSFDVSHDVDRNAAEWARMFGDFL
ncbi:hypothetical protein AMAG_20553 [Allomyces macrogynus ATCC 38327]|uniref:F-box domain-containing protein n=1 Tax=Allomyces macrogynus (strain ATCC 38327) TaxID=578462 RepID=A0A0L0TBM6_ALLM3|nr:hypothetical protein AMAG_20553 [Allomyces macrogynus ATCC 38327]|eukprot:KNE72162.1 hypothetical protein AMAG_20553 [Allomyces macrogynus ATCC 38327]